MLGLTVVITPSNLVQTYGRFEKMLPPSSGHKYLPGGHSTPFQNILTMDAARSFTTPANLHQTAWRRVPEDGIVETTLV
jgi:hypothetical protein